MAVYPEIAAFGGDKAAAYIGAISFSNLALSSFRDSLSASVGKVLQLAVPSNPPYAVRFESADGQTTGHRAEGVDTVFEMHGHEVSLQATEAIVLNFSLGVLDAGHFAGTFTKLRLVVRDLAFTVDIGTEALVCSPGEAQIDPSFVRDEGDFDATLTHYGLDRDAATRVEGMLLYSGLATALSKTISYPHVIDLRRLFPGVIFQGRLEFEISADRHYLFLKGANGVERRPESICGCGDVGNGIGPVNPGELRPAPQPDPRRGIGTITIGGPSPVVASPAILGRRRQGEGDSGFYMPTVMARAIVDGPFPGFRLDISDNGFIGWKAAAFVDFSKLDFTPEPQLGRFLVELHFRVEVYGSVHVDLGKLGKIRVTDFSAKQTGPGVNLVKVGFYAVIGTKGIYIKPVVEDVHFDPFQVSLTWNPCRHAVRSLGCGIWVYFRQDSGPAYRLSNPAPP